MIKILAIILAVACALGGYHFALDKGFQNPYPVVCDLVASKIYLPDEKINKWKKICLRRSRLVTPYSPRHLIIKDLNNVLALLKVSHLEVYDDSSVKKIWRGRALETGIESEFVDSELVIFKVHPGSPADDHGLKPGDIIKSINKEQPNPWEAQTESGTYIIVRPDDEFFIKLQARPIKKSQAITFKKISDTEGVLVIPSFRSEFFSDRVMANIKKDLAPMKKVVVDLRGNSGGNFVAGLNILSQFICKPTEVGRLVKPRFTESKVADMPATLKDLEQLAVLDKHKEVILKTFLSDFCFKGQVRVLVDGKSSSVAEMTAQALKEFVKAPLYGAPSRGQLLVGVWYPVDEIAPGVQISIPEALYITPQKHQIEGEGVQLDRVLYYNLQEMQAGIDSWVKRALD